MSDILERLVRIGLNLSDVFHGVGSASGHLLDLIMNELHEVVTYLLNDGINWDNSDHNNFTKHFLPRILEVLIHRKTTKEYIPNLVQLFKSVFLLLARKDLQNINELVELRNAMLGLSSANFLFISEQDIRLSRGNSSPQVDKISLLPSLGSSFFGQQGKPSMAVIAERPFYFWPDEWQKFLGEEKAIGHHIAVYNRILKIWRNGEVIAYDITTKLHSIKYEANSGRLQQGKYDEIGPDYVIERVDIGTAMHNWIDLFYVAEQSKSNLLKMNGFDNKEELSKLTYTSADYGKFVRIWWSRYQKYFYGCIVRVDHIKRHHCIIYEDGDTRLYDMSTRLFEVISIPDSIDMKQFKSAVDSTIAVAHWHQAQSLIVETLAINRPSKVTGQASLDDMGGSSELNKMCDVAFRPIAKYGYSCSVFLIDFINTFYKASGFTAIVQSMISPDQGSLSPTVVLLHLRMVLHLRQRVIHSFYRQLVWDVKEAVSYAISNFDDGQVKQFTREMIDEFVNILRELLYSVSSIDQFRVVSDAVKRFHLSLASRLLNCSQLHKRYLGLSIIKEAIDAAQLHDMASQSGKTAPSAKLPPDTITIFGVSSVAWVAGELAHWLVQNNIVESIFGSSLHQDLAARSDIILVFMGLRRVLEVRHLDALWACTLGGHEAVVRVLHQLILQLLPALETPLRQKLFQIVSSTPFNEVTEQMLMLLKSFTVRAISLAREEAVILRTGNATSPVNGDEKLWFGLEVLWQYVQDPLLPAVTDSGFGPTVTTIGELTSVHETKVDLAVQLIVDLLVDQLKDYREDFIQKCVENLTSGNSVPVSLKVLRLILASFPTSSSTWFNVGVGRPGSKQFTVGQHIDRLDRQHQLIDLFFSDFRRYQQHFLDQTGNIAGSTGGVAIIGPPSGIPTPTGSPIAMRHGGGVLSRNGSFTSAGGAFFSGLQRNGRSFVKIDSEPSTLLNEKRLRLNGKISRTTHIIGVQERLQFLKFVINGCNTFMLNKSQTFSLWYFLVENAPTIETTDCFFDWLNSLLNTEGTLFKQFLTGILTDSEVNGTSTQSKLAFLYPRADSIVSNDNDRTMSFEEGVIPKLFEEKAFPWALKFENKKMLSRLPVAATFLKLFLYVNFVNKGMKVEAAGCSWARVGQLTGTNLLWLLSCESSDETITQASSFLLVELHHRLGPKLKGTDDIRAQFLKRCFTQLSLFIHTLREKGNSAVHESEGAPTLSNLVIETTSNGKNSRNLWSMWEQESSSPGGRSVTPVVVPTATLDGDDSAWEAERARQSDTEVILKHVTRSVILMRQYIQRFSSTPSLSITLNIVASGGISIDDGAEISLSTTDTVHLLRERVSGLVRHSPDSILLSKQIVDKRGTPFSGGKTFEPLDNLSATLQSMNIKTRDVIMVKLTEVTLARLKSTQTSTKTSSGLTTFPDSILAADILDDNAADVAPFEWIIDEEGVELDRRAYRSGSVASADASMKDTAGVTADKSRHPLRNLFTTAFFPLPYHDDITLIPEKSDERLSSFRQSLVTTGAGSSVAEPALSALAEYLGPYLAQKTEHFDQLFDMLDGSLSAEIQGAKYADVDISSAVWDVVQSLPTHPELLHQIREQGEHTLTVSRQAHPSSPLAKKSFASKENKNSNPDDDGALPSIFRKFLNPATPYRLLYALQIMDIFVTNAVPDVYCSIKVPVEQYKASRVWTTKFLHKGGMEFLVSLLHSQLDLERRRILSNSNTSDLSKLTINTSIAHSTRSPDDAGGRMSNGVTRANAVILCFSLLLRLIHHLLCMDPTYHHWQKRPSDSAELVGGYIAATVDGKADSMATEEMIPRGFLLTQVDIERFVQSVMRFHLRVATTMATGLVSLSSFQALTENTLQVVLGLAMATPDGGKLLTKYANFERWTRIICVRYPDVNVRKGACRRLLETCGMILTRCSDPLTADDEKEPRILLYNYLFHTVICSENMKFKRVSLSDASSSQMSDVDVLKKSSDVSFFFESYADNDETGKLHHESEGILYTEQINTLLAMLIVLRARPQYLGDDIAFVQSQSLFSSSLLAGEFWVDEDSLCPLFVERLTSHKTTETFHSPEADGTLLGILRVLLILASGSSSQQDSIATMVVSDQSTSLTSPANFISFLYRTCLFPDDSIERVPLQSQLKTSDDSVSMGALCQTPESRGLVYALICKLCSSSDMSNFSELASAIGGNLLDGNTSDQSPTTICLHRMAMQWGYDPAMLTKAEDTYVGLVNQGATCYMNAFLQQIFHTPSFSNGLLSMERENQNEVTDFDNDDDEDIDDNEKMLFQLQVLFGYLSLSQKRYYDTLPFCKAFKDYDGQSVRLTEQKDINEFGSMLFEKLENNPLCADLLSKTFAGKLVWQIISTETSYKSEREEPFYMITAEVKDKASLEDSLELYVAGEMLTGDNKIEDSSAGRKVDAMRRCAIRQLPETLIIHLKRFEFDLETLNRKKLNDEMTFPKVLNMYPYTEEGIVAKEARLRIHSNLAADEPTDHSSPAKMSSWESDEPPASTDGLEHDADPLLTAASVDEKALHAHAQGNGYIQRLPSYYQYSLKGVVAHVGAIDSGHYYSFIKERRSDRWMEFNDRAVLPFDEELLPRECFGGIDTELAKNQSDIARHLLQKQNNAYLLFYERLPEGIEDQVSKAPSYAKDTPAAYSPTIQQKVLDPAALYQLELESDTNDHSDIYSKEANAVQVFSSPSTPESEKRRSSNFFGSISNMLQTRPSISKTVLQAVWSENMVFLRDRNLFSKSYFLFMWQLQKSPAVAALIGNQLIDNLSQVTRSVLVPEASVTRTRALREFALILLRFNVTIVSRARALECVPIFFESFGDLITRDESAITALTVLTELSKEPVLFQSTSSPLMRPNTASFSPAEVLRQQSGLMMRQVSVQTTGAVGTLHSKRCTRERALMEEHCHRSLLEMFLTCPHGSIVAAFSRLLFTCLVRIRTTHGDDYFAVLDTSALHSTSGDAGLIPALMSDPTRCEDLLDSYTSIVPKFMYKLTLLLENMRLFEVMNRDGYVGLSSLLFDFALLGLPERLLLVRLGCIYRLVLSILAVHPSQSKIPPDILVYTIRTVGVLVRSLSIQSAEPTVRTEDSKPKTASSAAISPYLYCRDSFGSIDKPPAITAEDLNTFYNKIFLQEAMMICPEEMTVVIQHVCFNNSGRECLKLVEFLGEKVVESVHNGSSAYSSGNITASSSVTDLIAQINSSRPYFHALLNILRSNSHNIHTLSDGVLSTLLKRTEAMLSRTSYVSRRDSCEYVYSMYKLLLLIGISSREGQAYVVRMRDLWLSVRHRMKTMYR